jgi:Protein of unknown function (DUF3309)
LTYRNVNVSKFAYDSLGVARRQFVEHPLWRINIGAHQAAAMSNEGEHIMSIGTILLIVLILMLVGVLPVWPHATSWGYGPSGIVGVILVIVIVLFLMGRL